MTISLVHAPAAPVLPPANPPGTPRPQQPKPKGSAELDARMLAGLLAEQNHQLFDLDTDSLYPVPPTMRRAASS